MRSTILSISEARKRIFDIAEDVQKPGKHYTFTENGKPKVVMMSAEEFDSLMEDIEILNNPTVMANIKKAEEEFERGEYVTWDEMKKELAKNRRAMVVADKPKRKYNSKREKK